ncbi:aldehyde dehydrogenase family protein [Horticoccus luteus]|uniref:aldehyde dehydrogenase (NAD(+)) n=1 Tax=Horticoccus luteus TaxID=2862869 RepID=A0A8F9TTY3_9BACT|nr:aldehyde dehydrogenase family protein [Horticoccus luteus]QYM78042.1 aldehyde dehydrogenase family protein [Horticoccus luteus]
MKKKSGMTSVAGVARAIFPELGLSAKSNAGVFDGAWRASGETVEKCSPIDGKPLARVRHATGEDYERVAAAAQRAGLAWREVPAPKRGEVVRQLGNALRERKAALGRLVSLEAGKIIAEGEGEVQEMIDICDFAVGLSRQLHGLTIASERPGHRMMEQWHPLGVVGIISAFNFPVAVWSWNSAVAAVAGNATLWKPSEKTPLTAIACVKIAEKVCRANGVDPAIFGLVIGDGATVGERLAADRRVALVSATGSTRMGKRVGEVVAQRLGRTLLELGGNNAIIVAPSADLELAVRGILFGAVGTAGQRCTSTRRLIVHESVKDKLVARLVAAYGQLSIGNPLQRRTLVGPLIDEAAVAGMMNALAEAKRSGGTILCGGERRRGLYVSPCLVEARNEWPVVQAETFAPILYVMSYRTLEEAIAWQNAVPQGLSSAIFTRDLREAETFLSARGSDCGIANVNIGTSGAEIGGAFGGEKETGGGRESGSDAWKAYMRRQTATVNYSDALPLAQGITFGAEG